MFRSNGSISKESRFVAVSFLIYIVLFLGYLNSNVITNSAITSDGAHNTRMAYNLVKYGILSGRSTDGETPEPTNYREPLPPIITAFIIKTHPKIERDIVLGDLLDGEHTRHVKQVNLVWSFVLVIGVFVLTYLINYSGIIAMLSVVLVSVYFVFPDSGYIDGLYTELPAATIIVWTTLFVVLSFRSEKAVYIALSGVTIGLLVLTKASMLYVALGIVVVYIWHAERCYVDRSRAYKVKRVIIFVIAFVLVIGPWSVRNKTQFGSYEIAQRGGVVLLVRAYKNQMNKEEVVGSFYMYGPSLYKRIIQNTRLDIDPGQYELGGSLQRLNRVPSGCDRSAEKEGRPEDACSFYTSARAERVKARKAFNEVGIENPTHAADQYLKDKSLKLILQEPGRHLLMTTIFFWRGMWSLANPVVPLIDISNLLSGNRLTYLTNLFNLICTVNLFAMFMFSIIRKNMDIVALTTLAVGIIMFYALLTHNIPRYSVPTIPVMLIAALSTVSCVVQTMYTKLRRFNVADAKNANANDA